jgi:hypothetical protein
MYFRKFAALASTVVLLGLSTAACSATIEEPEGSTAEEGLGLKNKCLTVRCMSGYRCVPSTGACVPSPIAECANVRCMSGTKNIPGLGCCLFTCGGITGKACATGTVCVDDPTDSCDPLHGGADCGGVCVAPPPPADCRTSGCGTGSWCSACRAASGVVYACLPNGAVC